MIVRDAKLLPKDHQVRQALDDEVDVRKLKRAEGAKKGDKKGAAEDAGWALQTVDACTRDDGDVAVDTGDTLGKQEVRALGRKLFKRDPTDEEENFLMEELQQDRDDDGNVTREELSSWCVTKIVSCICSARTISLCYASPSPS